MDETNKKYFIIVIICLFVFFLGLMFFISKAKKDISSVELVELEVQKNEQNRLTVDEIFEKLERMKSATSSSSQLSSEEISKELDRMKNENKDNVLTADEIFEKLDRMKNTK